MEQQAVILGNQEHTAMSVMENVAKYSTVLKYAEENKAGSRHRPARGHCELREEVGENSNTLKNTFCFIALDLTALFLRDDS